MCTCNMYIDVCMCIYMYTDVRARMRLQVKLAAAGSDNTSTFITTNAKHLALAAKMIFRNLYITRFRAD